MVSELTRSRNPVSGVIYLSIVWQTFTHIKPFNLHRVDQEINQLNFLNRMFTLQMICCSVAIYCVPHCAARWLFVWKRC